jgi:hypothetical protein
MDEPFAVTAERGFLPVRYVKIVCIHMYVYVCLRHTWPRPNTTKQRSPDHPQPLPNTKTHNTSSDPLVRLPPTNPLSLALEQLGDDLPKLLVCGNATLRREIERRLPQSLADGGFKLPLGSLSGEEGERLLLLLSFVAHAYVWCVRARAWWFEGGKRKGKRKRRGLRWGLMLWKRGEEGDVMRAFVCDRYNAGHTNNTHQTLPKTNQPGAAPTPISIPPPLSPSP